MVAYSFNKQDFDRAFQFGVDYYLDPSKAPSGRTTGEPRGLGAVLDAFMRGKLVEIGFQNMLKDANGGKTYELNFNIMSTSKVKDEPDINGIIENGIQRAPKLFIEIKGISNGDRWLGLTEEQLATIKKSSKGKLIIIPYVSLTSTGTGRANPKISDILGMYLKEISGSSNLSNFLGLNLSANLEFIISADELEKYGTVFPAGDMFYETDIFLPQTIWKRGGMLKAGIIKSNSYQSYNGNICVPLMSGREDKRVGQFDVAGSFDLYLKQNKKSSRHFIYCLSDTTISNNIFGTFEMKMGKCYDFNMITVGRDPKLKRNNLFISVNRVKELLRDGMISQPQSVLQYVANAI